jgi:TonB family protein
MKDDREPWPYLLENFPEAVESAPTPSRLDEAYTFVEQMPLLNGQPMFPATVTAITHAMVMPADAPAGRVFVQFVVTKEGEVSQLRIARSLRADVDSAVVAAARRLPRFTPGQHKGQAVAVRLTLPITFSVQK